MMNTDSKMFLAYVEAALWSSTDQNDDPFDANYTFDDIDKTSLSKMVNDCESFFNMAESIYSDSAYTLDQLGHDFWLTRNRHGAGFWEADHCTKEQGIKLTSMAHSFGECNLYVGDDGKVYL